jgi:hypothetical protein
MQKEIEPAFTLDKQLVANPHLSEYFHRLEFSPMGSIKMADGAGQMVISIVQGSFSISPIDQNSILVNFYDLVELHPYKDDQPCRPLEPSSIKVTREEGLFAFRGRWWGTERPKEDEWPCMLYWARYFFEVDPLAQLSHNRRGSAYHRIMVEPDTRYYYCQDDLDADMLTITDLHDLGIALQPDAQARKDFHDKIVIGYH